MSDWQKIKAEIQGAKGFAQWVRGQVVPSGDRLAEEARQRASQRRWKSSEPSEEQLRRSANEFLCDVLDTEYQLYLEYEDNCVGEAVRLALTPEASKRYPEQLWQPLLKGAG